MTRTDDTLCDGSSRRVQPGVFRAGWTQRDEGLFCVWSGRAYRAGRQQGRYQSYHYDLHGSTTLLTDENGRVTDTYGLYGERESHEGTTRQPFCYNGRDGVMTDPNGLYYMRARYYHTGIKRFLNRDVLRGSIVEGQTFNRFGYVNGDPVSFIDPFGLNKNSSCKDGTGDRAFCK
ncbi:RHS repeat-associated core domain-containing protein [Paenibacillus algorifonticola]|uniref:RHS repeat-associated core domain-containing protein n=1 Tax=Paenibacillus algorifonticola TaxID=684063 RepID=A0A1I2EVT5_9BACL|nr:RHS repeat-associated core domain-containing protein [Paenibacillus algorifonticola]SFE97202.1 RHS repeat-associated core domain-containing protein [Paenibacillus algorifonticola]